MITVMVAGLPGRMATLVVGVIEKTKDLKIVSAALSEIDENWLAGTGWITLVPLEEHEATLKQWVPDVVVDFTVPAAVNRNAELYCNCGIPFVMGTTGGDRDLLKKTVESSKICAVIAPNMAPQIVVFQAMMEYAAKNFPDSFKGYCLRITESHQQGKKDTSGTAKAMVQYFNALGIPFTVDQIIMERNPRVQETSWGVPKNHLGGHAYHRYTLLSEDRTVLFEFRHNVNGRNIYIPGVLRAIRFLDEKVQRGAQGIVFSMTDVLRE